jgi:FKBP-type peptidyl-prolyl cis-trans isomerase
MRSCHAVVVLALAGVVFAAPVPKPSDKVDPGKPWDFPDLDSKGWEKKESGLKVWDVKEGEGAAVTAGATVTVSYVGWLTDGNKFDSSLEHRAPPAFPLNQVIKGWQEGMIGMKPGGIRRLSIPPELAYGKRGAPGQIPGDATLVFVVEYIGPGDK